MAHYGAAGRIVDEALIADLDIIANERVRVLTRGIDLTAPGLEIAPLFRPTVHRSQADVSYTDYTTAEDLRQKNSSNPWMSDIVDIDFVWHPGRRLADCTSRRFGWATASHVVEHVPDMIEWLQQILEVVHPGGVLTLAVPDRRDTMDCYRPETTVADLIDVWMRQEHIPSPRQVYDCLSHVVDVAGHAGDRASRQSVPFEKASRFYTEAQALRYAADSWQSQTYLDVHATVWTPDSFRNALAKLTELGILNVEVSEPVGGNAEFFCTIIKRGEPSFHLPRRPEDDAAKSREQLEAHLAHARKAFMDAVAVQEVLKRQYASTEADLAHAHQAFIAAVAVQADLEHRNRQLEQDLAHARKAFTDAVAVQETLKEQLQRGTMRRLLPPRLSSGAAVLRRAVKGARSGEGSGAGSR